MMDARPTGIELIGAAPWGTHFCQFYATREDLFEVLVPYFKAGLENDELCLWVTSPLHTPAEVWQRLGAAVPELAGFRERGCIEVISHTDWYLPDGRFDGDRVLEGWLAKLQGALTRKLAGLRLAGDTFWLEKTDWPRFTEYEARVDAVIAPRPMLALCAYPVAECGAVEVADIIKNHRYALIKRDGVWDLISNRRLGEEISRREKAEAQARAERQRFDAVLETLPAYLILLSPDYHVPYANRFFRERFGESHGRRCYEYLFDRTEPCEVCETYTVLKTGLPTTWEWTGPDNRNYYIYDFPFTDTDGSRLIMEMGIDITEHKRAEAELRHHQEHLQELVDEQTVKLRSQTAALAEANEAKDLFFNTLSHELRTPLAAMLSSLEVLKNPEAATDQRRRVLELLERNVRHQTRLIDDLLDLSRVMRKKVELACESLDLRQLLAAHLEGLEAAASSRRLRLSLQAPEQPVPVSADPVRLGQVISNLLGNAIKFTPDGGTVLALIAIEGEQAVLRVRDSGAGIPAELLPHVFEAFRQAETSLVRRNGGLGIGLAIARSLAELHGGSLEASSEGPGHGSEFVLRLPLRAGAALPAGATPVRAADLPGQRILIVEDSPDLRESMTMLLELMGHTVLAAPDGRSALEIARREPLQTMLIDIGLPDMDGYQIARQLRDEAGTRHLRLVALTGYAAPEHRQRARAAGFDHHLAKPVEMEELEAVLRAERQQPAELLTP